MGHACRDCRELPVAACQWRHSSGNLHWPTKAALTAQVADYAGKMLGNKLVTKQSGPEGKPVDTLLLAKKMQLVNEM